MTDDAIDYEDVLEKIKEVVSNTSDKLSKVEGSKFMDMSTLLYNVIKSNIDDTIVIKDNILGAVYIRNVYPDVLDRGNVCIDVNFVPKEKSRVDSTDTLMLKAP